ncbi:MAG: SRPBCC family protein [Jiangellaceae bacterium]
MSPLLRVEQEVGASAERVWSVLTDWERQGEWIPATRVSAHDGHAVGGRIEARTGLGPFGFLDTMTITAWDPPRRCEVQHTGRLVRGPGTFEVESLGATRSRVIWEERLDLPLGMLGRAGWPLVRPLARAALALALRRFVRTLVR